VRRICIAITFAVLAATLAGGERPAGGQAISRPAYLVVVHPDTRIASVSREFLADVFLKKRTRWPGDVVIRPVDLHPRSEVRQRFSASVLRRPVAAVRSYWRQIIYSGRGVPPPELRSDDDVVAYVRRHQGAIGYVSPTADLIGVRVVAVR